MAHVAMPTGRPYDVIDTPLQDQLYQASPFNIIRLELNCEESGDSPETAGTPRLKFKDWRAAVCSATRTTLPLLTTRPHGRMPDLHPQQSWPASV